MRPRLRGTQEDSSADQGGLRGGVSCNTFGRARRVTGVDGAKGGSPKAVAGRGAWAHSPKQVGWRAI